MGITRWLKQRNINKAFYENQKKLQQNKTTRQSKDNTKKSKFEMYTTPGVDEIIDKK